MIRFTDVTREAGIRFVHTDGSAGRRYIVESVAAGLATFDYHGDGDIDIYFLNGTPLPGSRIAPPPQNALYRNDGNWKFTDVTQLAGVGRAGYGLGVCVGDYDNDGDADFYLNNFGPNVLFRNNGDGTFTDVTQAAGVANGSKVGAGACFLDIDNDRDLDLYVGNYGSTSHSQDIRRVMSMGTSSTFSLRTCASSGSSSMMPSILTALRAMMSMYPDVPASSPPGSGFLRPLLQTWGLLEDPCTAHGTVAFRRADMSDTDGPSAVLDTDA